MKTFCLALIALGLIQGHAALASPVIFETTPLPADVQLERVVLVARHGIRSPTHSPEILEKETGIVWPVWPVAPGQLTDHGRATLAHMMRDIAAYYDLACTHHERPCLGQPDPVIWSDSGDDRTRQSGQIMAEAFAPGRHLKAQSLPAGAHDPLFDSVTPQFLAENGAHILSEMQAVQQSERQARPEAVQKGLAALQKLIAPEGCLHNSTPCFSAPLALGRKKDRPVLQGGPVLAASIAENLLLVHVQGLEGVAPIAGRTTTSAYLMEILPVHEYLSDLARRNGLLAKEKSRILGAAIMQFLNGEAVSLSDGSVVSRTTRLLAFAGHDTTLDALAARFGLGWHFADQPDRTAPDTTLAFESWRDRERHMYYRVVVFHQSLAALRSGGGLDRLHGGVMNAAVTQ